MPDANAGSKQATKPRRVFVTGAAGRLGAAALRVLGAAGCEVVGIDVRADPAMPEVRQLDLLEGAAVRAALEGCDAIVHLGNHAHQRARPPAQLFNENVTMTMNVFDAARALGIRRIIYASTIQVAAAEWLDGYSLRRPRIAYLPLDGDLPADPTNPYALSKYVGETILAQWATEMDIEAVSLRLPWLLNLADARTREWRGKWAAEEPSPTCIAQGFSWMSYPDAAELIGALLKAQWTGAQVLMPTSLQPRTTQSIDELVEKYYAGVPRKRGFEGPLQALVDISAITRQTSWAPRDLLP